MEHPTLINSYAKGFRDGIPIGLGYLSVSFTFGMMAVSMGLPVWAAVLISMTNLTSAGQFAGLSLIVSGAPMVEMALTQFIINLRYALMSLSLSQKLDKTVTTFERCLIAFGNTDENLCRLLRAEGDGGQAVYGGADHRPLPWLDLGHPHWRRRQHHPSHFHPDSAGDRYLRHVYRHHCAAGKTSQICADCPCDLGRSQLPVCLASPAQKYFQRICYHYLYHPSRCLRRKIFPGKEEAE